MVLSLKAFVSYSLFFFNSFNKNIKNYSFHDMFLLHTFQLTKEPQFNNVPIMAFTSTNITKEFIYKNALELIRRNPSVYL